MLKTEKLATIATTILTMTYVEVKELAAGIDCDPDDVADWAEKYRTPEEDKAGARGLGS